MTAPRFGLVSLLLFVFLFSPSRFIQISALTIIFLNLFDFIYLRYTASKLVICRSDKILRGFCGVAFDVEISITNYSRLPIYGAIFYDSAGILAASDSTHRILSIPKRKQIIVNYSINAHDRGEYELGPASIRLKSLFSLYEKRVIFSERCRVVIFPKILFINKPFFAQC